IQQYVNCSISSPVCGSYFLDSFLFSLSLNTDSNKVTKIAIIKYDSKVRLTLFINASTATSVTQLVTNPKSDLTTILFTFPVSFSAVALPIEPKNKSTTNPKIKKPTAKIINDQMDSY